MDQESITTFSSLTDAISDAHVQLNNLYNDTGFLNSSTLSEFISIIIPHLNIVIEDTGSLSDDQL
jgi:hypothetical protein